MRNIVSFVCCVKSSVASSMFLLVLLQKGRVYCLADKLEEMVVKKHVNDGGEGKEISLSQLNLGCAWKVVDASSVYPPGLEMRNLAEGSPSPSPSPSPGILTGR